MSNPLWLTLIGWGEDGLDGLSIASQKALKSAEWVFGAERHLSLLPAQLVEKSITWPVPFESGIKALLQKRGQNVVMLTSGDPFWYGAGSVITRHLDPEEWTAHPAPSCFSLAASHLGWSLETTKCHALHAAPFSKIKKDLHPHQRCLVTLRDGQSAAALAQYLCEEGFGDSTLTVCEAMGGPRQRVRKTTAKLFDFRDVIHPVMAAIEPSAGPSLPFANGLADELFEHDGQITKSPIRALTLSALAPHPGERLWDIGAGSGSISIEWLLAHPTCQAIALEANAIRVKRIVQNASRFGVDRLQVIHAKAPEGLNELDPPDAVFIGGGLNEELLLQILGRVRGGTRLVINAVTLESEALLIEKQRAMGGQLMRFDISSLNAIGTKRGWKAAYPVVQWSVTI